LCSGFEMMMMKNGFVAMPLWCAGATRTNAWLLVEPCSFEFRNWLVAAALLMVAVAELDYCVARWWWWVTFLDRVALPILPA